MNADERTSNAELRTPNAEVRERPGYDKVARLGKVILPLRSSEFDVQSSAFAREYRLEKDRRQRRTRWP